MEETPSHNVTSDTGLDMKTRFLPGQTFLTGTTYRKRRGRSKSQHTLSIENVSCRPLHDKPSRTCAHPANKPSSTYKVQNAAPDRVYCEVERTRYGGESLKSDKYQEWWDRGEHWNRDSNIRQWTWQESRRHASQGAHDVHRHDQINHELLAADRENPVNLFKVFVPPRHFDEYDPKPGAARRSCGIHTQAERANDEYGYCFDGEGVRPAAIFTKKYKKMGEAAFRQRGTWMI